MESKLKVRFGRIYNYPALVFIIVQLYFGEVCGLGGVGSLEVSCSLEAPLCVLQPESWARSDCKCEAQWRPAQGFLSRYWKSSKFIEIFRGLRTDEMSRLTSRHADLPLF